MKNIENITKYSNRVIDKFIDKITKNRILKNYSKIFFKIFLFIVVLIIFFDKLILFLIIYFFSKNSIS